MSEPLDLDAIEERVAGTTDGPWEADLDSHGETRGVWPTGAGEEIIVGSYVAADGFDSVDFQCGTDENLTFIAHARTDVPALIARVRELEPRVLEGDWETVRDALDALPLGTVIKWSDDLGYSAAIKCPNGMGDARWFEAGVRNPRSSESIARDETPIDVIA